MKIANLIHITLAGAASLITRGDLSAVKKEFNDFKLKEGEELELIGLDIDEPKRRGGSRDGDAYLATVAEENEAMTAKRISTIKARNRKAGSEKPDPKALAKSAAAADDRKSDEVNRIKAEQAKKHRVESPKAPKAAKPPKAPKAEDQPEIPGAE